jgi:hypothetical protein
VQAGNFSRAGAACPNVSVNDGVRQQRLSGKEIAGSFFEAVRVRAHHQDGGEFGVVALNVVGKLVQDRELAPSGTR